MTDRKEVWSLVVPGRVCWTPRSEAVAPDPLHQLRVGPAMSPPRASQPNRGDPAQWHGRAIEAGALFLLVFTPLAFGTVQRWSEGIAELVVLGMAVAWVLAMLRRRELRVELPPGWVPAMLFLALVLLQAMPLPSNLVGLVSPWSVRLHQTALAYTGTAVDLAPLSLAPHATWREAIKLLSVAALLLVLFNTLRTRGQLQRIVWMMIVMGTVLSVFGLVQRLTWNGQFYWIGPRAPHPSAFGPFENRTHFAALMVIVVPTALAKVLAARRDPGRRRLVRGWTYTLRRWNSPEAGPTGLVAVLTLLMGGTALVSGSRGGMVALLAGLLTMIGLGRSITWRARELAVAAALLILAGMLVGGDILYGTVGRLVEEISRPRESTRVRIWADALDLWRGAPALGTGLATFGAAFPSVRTIEGPGVFASAESDWIQLLTDTGAGGFLLALAAVGALARRLHRRSQYAESLGARTFALAALAGLVGTVVQGIGNFNLFVMSNWVYFVMVLVPGLRDWAVLTATDGHLASDGRGNSGNRQM